MNRHCLLLALATTLSWSNGSLCVAAEALTVEANFEGASVHIIKIDDVTRTITFMPGGDPARGWPCWWYFKINGMTPGEAVTLNLQASTATIKSKKPLAASWSMVTQATYSSDGEKWSHTEKGMRVDESMQYVLTPATSSVYVAWGPPYTPATATKFVQHIAEKSPFAKAEELCRSRAGRTVPMLHIQEGERLPMQRFGVWIQARQHAWECGSSWVAQGVGEWLISDDSNASWLRQHAEIYLVPIMDVDNTATGNGGKNEQPQDHNRDWSEMPHWHETIAAKNKIEELVKAGRMDIFIDLHNPGPGDPTFFYVIPPDMLHEPMIGLRNRFIDVAYERISKVKPFMPMSSKTKATGVAYDSLWQQISSNWVSMHGNQHTVSLTLETAWNFENSTTEGYRAVGAKLAESVQVFLKERPLR